MPIRRNDNQCSEGEWGGLRVDVAVLFRRYDTEGANWWYRAAVMPRTGSSENTLPWLDVMWWDLCILLMKPLKDAGAISWSIRFSYNFLSINLFFFSSTWSEKLLNQIPVHTVRFQTTIVKMSSSENTFVLNKVRNSNCYNLFYKIFAYIKEIWRVYV